MNKKYKATIAYNPNKDKYELRFIVYFYDNKGNFHHKKALWINDGKFNLNIMVEGSEIPCIDLDALTISGEIITRKL